jgi:hypothetical protein
MGHEVHIAWLHVVFAAVCAGFLYFDNVFSLSWDNALAAVATSLVTVSVSLLAAFLSVSGMTFGATMLSLCVATEVALDAVSAHLRPPLGASSGFRAATAVFGGCVAASALCLPCVARARRNVHGPGRAELVVPVAALALALVALVGSAVWLGGWIFLALPTRGWLQLLQGCADVVVRGMGPFVAIALQAASPLAPEQTTALAVPCWLLLLSWCVYVPGAAQSMATSLSNPMASIRDQVYFVCQFVGVASLMGASAGIAAVFARLRKRARALSQLPLYHQIPSKDSPYAGAMAAGVSGVPPEYYAPPLSSAELAYVK